ncbi:efflux transporter periplasmic adaptor subunit [Sphingomonas oleivorans]|uniref:Efflux transporter periplasmic adaptor subunit n=1 Tax=Sphingomonas oleivorans TaxID=1735121 RepID=A0A2T5FY98_9SPHN|nr:efflux RND transporter periplasmic adaptor subunit [Sphingomonas oleivorans]PTQ11508.1 efflux transporter periplasmic adaptor subunit [Sphingomonas oleivorans]
MRPILPILLSCLLISCGKGGDDKPRSAPLVTVAPVAGARFVDRIDALGTARAREQVTLAAPVTQRIERLYFDDGGYVRRGQVIAVLAQGQQSAQLADAQARQREADQQLTRLQALKERGFATNASLDTQVALAAQARAAAAEARAAIGDRVIRAPFSGWVSLRMISAGAVVTAGTEIATISDLSEIKLDFPVPETLLGAVRPGQPIAAKAAAFPDMSFAGRIATIDPVVDPNTRAVLVRAILPNPGNRLKPGMLMTVAVESAPRMAPSVPELAVVGQGEQRFVYLLQPDRSVKRTAVRVGVRDAGRVEIVQGVKPGDRVVTEGVVKLSDGAKVQLAGDADAKAGASAKKGG